MRHRKLIAALGLLVVTACSGEEPSASPLVVGVNDVGKACVVRTEWTKPTSAACLDCLALARIERCECTEGKEFAGKCSVQQRSVEAEADCAGVGECVSRCAGGACSCLEACYADKEACRARASAFEGCLAEVCDDHCR